MSFFMFFCASIRLGKKTWFKAVGGEVVDYLGGVQPGFCTCHSQNLCEGQRCYCDIGKWHIFSGLSASSCYNYC